MHYSCLLKGAVQTTTKLLQNVIFFMGYPAIFYCFGIGNEE